MLSILRFFFFKLILQTFIEIVQRPKAEGEKQQEFAKKLLFKTKKFSKEVLNDAYNCMKVKEK